jgi:hypothetical protein
MASQLPCLSTNASDDDDASGDDATTNGDDGANNIAPVRRRPVP